MSKFLFQPSSYANRFFSSNCCSSTALPITCPAIFPPCNEVVRPPPVIGSACRAASPTRRRLLAIVFTGFATGTAPARKRRGSPFFNAGLFSMNLSRSCFASLSKPGLAKQLLEYSIELQKGEVLYLEIKGKETPELGKQIIKLATEKGATPFWYYNDESLIRQWVRNAHDDQFKKQAELHM